MVILTFYGAITFYEGQMLMMWLGTLINMTMLFILLSSGGDSGYTRFAIVGFLLGLSALARANILIFLPVLLVPVVGTLLYFLATQKLPYDADSPYALLKEFRETRPRPLADARHDLASHGFERLIAFLDAARSTCQPHVDLADVGHQGDRDPLVGGEEVADCFIELRLGAKRRVDVENARATG